jgi:hypothetical protein
MLPSMERLGAALCVMVLGISSLVAGCSPASPSAAPSSSSASTCGELIALDEGTRDHLFGAGVMYTQYTDAGVVHKRQLGIFEELCPASDAATVLGTLTNKWTSTASDLCGRYLKEPTSVQAEWIREIPFSKAWLHPAPSDYVQACTGSEAATLHERVVQAESIATARDAAESPATAPATTAPPAQNPNVGTWTDPDGRQVRVTWSFPSAIKGSDTASLENTWSSVGGSGTAACFSNPTGGIDSYPIIPAKTTRVWVGTMLVENLNPTFGWPNILQMDFGLKSGILSYGYQSGSNKSCTIESSPITWSSISGNAIKVPFILVEHNAYTPNNPTGSSSNSLIYKITGMTDSGSTPTTIALSV